MKEAPEDSIVIVAVRGAGGPTTAGWRDCKRCGQPCSLGKESLAVLAKHPDRTIVRCHVCALQTIENDDVDIVQGLGSALGPRKLHLRPTLLMLALGHKVGVVPMKDKP